MKINYSYFTDCLQKFFFRTGLFITLFPLFFGSITVFPNSFFSLGLSSSSQIIIGMALMALSVFESSKNSLLPAVLSSVTVTFFYLISDVTIRSNGFFGDFFPYLPFLLALGILFVLPVKIRSIVPLMISVSAIFIGIFSLLTNTGNKLIFTDDHPSFLYRLTQIKHHFPNIPFYNPEWNGGVEAREFFASGILNVYFIFSPLIHFFEVEDIYNYMVIAILFILLPLSFIWAGKNLKLSWQAISVSICLALTHSIFWYRWALSYGTLGFIVSMILIPLNLSFISLLVDREKKITLFQVLVMAITLSLMLFWSLTAVLFLPVALLSLFLMRNSVNKIDTGIVLVLLLVINLPWINIFYQASHVMSFISSSTNSVESPHDESKFKLNSSKNMNSPIHIRTLNSLRKQALPVSPLILFFGIPGLIYLSKTRFKAILITFGISAASLGIFFSLLKPHLELDRMIVALTLVLSLPAAIFIEKILQLKQYRILPNLVLGLLLFTPAWVYKVSSNNSSEKYRIETDIVKQLAKEIKTHHGGGRTLFSGFSLHELDGGHLAPLPLWTKSPLIASSFQHDKWKYTDVIPLEYRSRKTDGVLEYLKIMNVSLVVSNDRFWRKWFLERPSMFERINTVGKFNVFKVKSFENNYFLEGTGTIIDQSGSQVRLKLDMNSAVIKFNYLPFLKSKSCELSPYKVSPSIDFIRISNCSQNTEVVINSSGVIERFF